MTQKKKLTQCGVDGGVYRQMGIYDGQKLRIFFCLLLISSRILVIKVCVCVLVFDKLLLYILIFV